MNIIIDANGATTPQRKFCWARPRPCGNTAQITGRGAQAGYQGPARGKAASIWRALPTDASPRPLR